MRSPRTPEYGGSMTPAERVRTTRLDEQLCFALYTASRAMTSCYRPMLDALGLTYPQFLVLLVLWERGDLQVTGIGQALQLETGTLSPLLKRLEATGLITRTRQAGDERSVLVGLTPAGRELEAQAAAVQRQVASATGLRDAEVATLRSALHTLTGSLRAAADH
jgi:DNA-binding MarR family transcriptional regulator